MLPLFAYGTLRDPDYQRELFGRTYQMHRARVADYIVLSTPTGYLAAAPRPGSAIDGAIVEIDAFGWEIADAWEDRSVYDRIDVQAYRPDGQIIACLMYVQIGGDGEPALGAQLADRTRAEVIADIRRFRAALGSSEQP